MGQPNGYVSEFKVRNSFGYILKQFVELVSYGYSLITNQFVVSLL